MAWIIIQAKQMCNIKCVELFYERQSMQTHFIGVVVKKISLVLQIDQNKRKSRLFGKWSFDVLFELCINQYSNIVSNQCVNYKYNKKTSKQTVSVLSKFGCCCVFLQACAPRYVFHTMQPRKVVRVEPVGTCYMAKKNFQEYTEYSPCRTSKWILLVICIWL